MANSEEKERGLRAMFMDGCIAQQYMMTDRQAKTGTFVKIRPAFSIDKIKFSFVTMRTEGEGLDVYVDTTVFDLWCEDILSYRFGKRMLSELNTISKNEKFDKFYYTYHTGKKGAMTIQFQPSSKYKGGSVIHGAGTNKGGKWETYNIPVDYNWLRTMAMIYKRVSAKYWNDAAATILKSSEWSGRVQEGNGQSYSKPQASVSSQNNGNMQNRSTPSQATQQHTYSRQASTSTVQQTKPTNKANVGYDISDDDLPF